MQKDIIQLILEDHNRGREMYRQYTAPGTNLQQKQLLARQMIRESSIHSIKEEQVGREEARSPECQWQQRLRLSRTEALRVSRDVLRAAHHSMVQ